MKERKNVKRVDLIFDMEGIDPLKVVKEVLKREPEKIISDILKQHDYRFIDFHNLKTRRSGSIVFAELHLSVASSLSVKEAHDLNDHLEADIKAVCPNINLTIHVEPS